MEITCRILLIENDKNYWLLGCYKIYFNKEVVEKSLSITIKHEC